MGFRFWNNPGPFAQYMGIRGSEGRFLGFFQVLMQVGQPILLTTNSFLYCVFSRQAVFSYLGSEVPGVAAGEV